MAHAERARESYLVVHDDLVGGRIEQRRLSEQLTLAVLVLLRVRQLHVVRRQRVERRHLILLVVLIVKTRLRTRHLQHANKQLHLPELVVLQLSITPFRRARMHSVTHKHRLVRWYRLSRNNRISRVYLTRQTL